MRDWLKSKRLEKGLTMAQMAGELGITESYYSNIEAGKRQKELDLTIAAQLAQILHMSIEEIVACEKEVKE